MRKKIIIGIIILLLVILLGLFLKGSSVENSKNSESEISRKVVFLDYYFKTENEWIDNLVECHLNCPNNSDGNIESACSTDCLDLFDKPNWGDQFFKNYSESDYNNWEEDIYNDPRTRDLNIKTNCVVSCDMNKSCLGKCID